MTTLNEVTTAYSELQAFSPADEAVLIKAGFRFEKLLLSSNEIDFLNLHYSLLRGAKFDRIRFILRKAFVSRPEVDEYLFEKIQTENDLACIADIIHILGRKRSSHVIGLARINIDRNSDYLKEVCLYVLGWVGEEKDIATMEDQLLHATPERLRITAGSALRQVYIRHQDLKLIILRVLKTAFYAEIDRSVRSRIMELIGSIAVKNLGMRESKDDPDILLGDYNRAIEKTNVYLQSID